MGVNMHFGWVPSGFNSSDIASRVVVVVQGPENVYLLVDRIELDKLVNSSSVQLFEAGDRYSFNYN